MSRTRTQYILYAVVLREHEGVVKLGRTTKWRSRRVAYDNWNLAQGDGVAECVVFCITEEYVDLTGLEAACLDAMAHSHPIHRGTEWFRGTLAAARAAIESVLNAAQVAYLESGNPARGAHVVKLAFKEKTV